MDLLKKELERKKKALQQAKQHAADGGSGGSANGTGGSSGGSHRFLKASQLRKLQEEAEDTNSAAAAVAAGVDQRESSSSVKKNNDEPRKKKQRLDEDNKKGKNVAAGGKRRKGSTSPAGGDREEGGAASPEAAATEEEATAAAATTGGASTMKNITARLRSMGLAVRMFGETDAARQQRLRQALDDEQKQLATLSERDEFRLGQGHSIRNPFLEKDKDGNGQASMPGKEGGDDDGDGEDNKKKKDDDDDFDLTDETDPPKRIYKYFKSLLRQWEDDLVERPDAVRRSVAGRNETKTFQQCQDYIRPLFKLCKKRKLEPGLTAHLTKIVDFCLQGEFVSAHDTYLDVAIGRAAWPIGVTMVGIHARTGRAKIESSNVAHVMNSELQRKYLTSVKRLMTYAQKKRTDVDPSKKVMN